MHVTNTACRASTATLSDNATVLYNNCAMVYNLIRAAPNANR